MAKGLVEEGFNVIKIKIGLDPLEDLERVKAVREVAKMEGPWCYVDDVVEKTMDIDRGMVKTPENLGIGVAIDEEKVNRYRVTF